MNRLIQCKNLTLQYDRHIAVQNATFSVEPGDFLCIVGENGSGKSTLAQRAMLGLLPLARRPESAMPTTRLPHCGIGYVPQQTTVQRDFPATVWEIVLSGCLPQPRETAAVLHRSRKTAAHRHRSGPPWTSQICAVKATSCQHLSGGQQQRVLLARALCAADRLFCSGRARHRAWIAQAAAALYAALGNLYARHGYGHRHGIP